jgi:hypothetical protein
VPPIMFKTDSNPGGQPISVFDQYRQNLAANRAQFYRAVAAGPFYGFNRPVVGSDDDVARYRSGHYGRFPGLVVIADRLTKSEIQADANLSIARADDDEEDRRHRTTSLHHTSQGGV